MSSHKVTNYDLCEELNVLVCNYLDELDHNGKDMRDITWVVLEIILCSEIICGITRNGSITFFFNLAYLDM